MSAFDPKPTLDLFLTRRLTQFISAIAPVPHVGCASGAAQMKGPLHGRRAGNMDEVSVEYFRQRECTEREAASNATCETARLSHEQLADGYAALVRDAGKQAGKRPFTTRV